MHGGNDEGQALIVAVLFVAVAAVAIVGLRDVQDRLLDAERTRRAGEAAVEAAVAVFADAFATHASEEPREAMSEPLTRERARVAADEMSLANGGVSIEAAPVVSCGPHGVEVSLSISGRYYRAGFAGSCSRP